jgi:hypothetical protein
MRKRVTQQRTLAINSEDPFAMIFMNKKTKTGPLSQRGFGVTSRDFKSFNSDIADEIKVD